MIKFSDVMAGQRHLGLDYHASELHGVVTGFICAGGWQNRINALLNWLGVEAGDRPHDRSEERGREFLENLFLSTRASLADTEFGFQVLIPDEQATLSERSDAIGRWCAGFLSGFGMAGNFDQIKLNEEAAEIFEDLQKLSVLSNEVPDTDDNEADLTEIVEFVRVSALLLFADYALPIDQESH